MRHLLPIALLLALVFSCKPTVPSDYIQPDDMEEILYDYHVAQAMGRDGLRSEQDYEENAYFLAALRKHSVTEAEFDTSLVYYYTHAERLKGIYEHVSERLNNEAATLGVTSGSFGLSSYGTTGDTANVWNGASEVLLMPLPTANRYDFTLKADTSYHKGDSFMFQFNAEYIYEAGSRDAVVCLLSAYEGDSIIQTVYHITMSGRSQIRVPANRDGRLKEMKGFVYLASDHQDRNVRRMMFINNLQLIRFHQKKEEHPAEKPLTAEPVRINDEIKKDSLPRAAVAQPLPVDEAGRDGKARGGVRNLPVKPGIPLHRVDTKMSGNKK